MQYLLFPLLLVLPYVVTVLLQAQLLTPLHLDCAGCISSLYVLEKDSCRIQEMSSLLVVQVSRPKAGPAWCRL